MKRIYTIEFFDSYQGTCTMDGEFVSAENAKAWAVSKGFNVTAVYPY